MRWIMVICFWIAGIGFSGNRVQFLADAEFSTDTTFDGLQFGGLSGLTYIPSSNEYLAISDDNGKVGPARFYRLGIAYDSPKNSLNVQYRGTVTLMDQNGKTFAPGTFDAEGMAYDTTSDHVFVSTEGSAFAKPPVNPGIFEFSREGKWIGQLPVPTSFSIATGKAKTGSRNNLGFEGLTMAAKGHVLLAGMESALVQDGDVASLKKRAKTRLLTFALGKKIHVTDNTTYQTDTIPNPTGLTETKGDNGVSEILALSGKELLLLERSFVPETLKVNCRLYSVQNGKSQDKALLFQFDDAIPQLQSKTKGIDNLEGMALGPKLPDGRRLLIVVSDNNFNPMQRTQFIALALKE